MDVPLPAKMRFKIGAPATGTDYFPREDVETDLRNALERDHVLFLGPRRTGKTSLLYRIDATAPSGTACFSVNLEPFAHPEEWVAAMLACLAQDPRFHPLLRRHTRIPGRLLKGLESLRLLGIAMKFRPVVADRWQQSAEELHTCPHLLLAAR